MVRIELADFSADVLDVGCRLPRIRTTARLERASRLHRVDVEHVRRGCKVRGQFMDRRRTRRGWLLANAARTDEVGRTRLGKQLECLPDTPPRSYGARSAPTELCSPPSAAITRRGSGRSGESPRPCWISKAPEARGSGVGDRTRPQRSLLSRSCTDHRNPTRIQAPTGVPPSERTVSRPSLWFSPAPKSSGTPPT